VTRTAVYQYGRANGVTAIARGSGKKLWQSAGGVDLLAEAKGRAYLISKAKMLIVMDNSRGKELYTMNLADVSVHASNPVDSRVYIGDDQGRVMCLKPAK